MSGAPAGNEYDSDGNSSEEDEALDLNGLSSEQLMAVVQRYRQRLVTSNRTIELNSDRIKFLQKQRYGNGSQRNPNPVATEEEDALITTSETLQKQLKAMADELNAVKAELEKQKKARTLIKERQITKDEMHEKKIADLNRILDKRTRQLETIEESFETSDQRNTVLTREIKMLRDIVLESGNDGRKKLEDAQITAIAVSAEDLKGNLNRVAVLEDRLRASRIALPFTPGVDPIPTAKSTDKPVKRKTTPAAEEGSKKLKLATKAFHGGTASLGRGRTATRHGKKRQSADTTFEDGLEASLQEEEGTADAQPDMETDGPEDASATKTRYLRLLQERTAEIKKLKLRVADLEIKYMKANNGLLELTYRVRSLVTELFNTGGQTKTFMKTMAYQEQYETMEQYWKYILGAYSHRFDPDTLNSDLFTRLKIAMTELFPLHHQRSPQQLQKINTYWETIIQASNGNPSFRAIVTGVPDDFQIPRAPAKKIKQARTEKAIADAAPQSSSIEAVDAEQSELELALNEPLPALTLDGPTPSVASFWDKYKAGGVLDPANAVPNKTGLESLSLSVFEYAIDDTTAISQRAPAASTAAPRSIAKLPSSAAAATTGSVSASFQRPMNPPPPAQPGTAKSEFEKLLSMPDSDDDGEQADTIEYTKPNISIIDRNTTTAAAANIRPAP